MIYFIEAQGVGHIKIGFTDQDDALIRLEALQTGSPVPLRLLGSVPGTLEAEKDLHRRFAAARVQGEWFKPVVELLALIPAHDLPSCGEIEVVEQSVQIRVLTVGRKQFSKSLLNQISARQLINWYPIFAKVIEQGREVDVNDLIAETEGAEIWGWVVGEAEAATLKHQEKLQLRWIIFVEDGRLMKHKDYLNAVSVLDGTTWRAHRALHDVYRKRLLIPGWNQQLFIGV